MTTDPAALLARIPMLRGLDPAAFTVAPIRDGAPEAGRLLAIEGYGEVLAARPPGFSDPVGSKAEAQALALAAPLGLAPPTLYYDPADGFWVIPALSGLRPMGAALRDGDRLGRLAAGLRRLHVGGLVLSVRSDPFDVLQVGAERIRNMPAGLPQDGLYAITDVARECRIALMNTTPTPVACLYAAGPWACLDTGTRVLFLDWRAAAMSDAHYDLAHLIETWGLSARQEEVLLSAYFGADQGRGPDRVRVFRLVAAHRIMMDDLAEVIAGGPEVPPDRRAHLNDLMSRCRDIIEDTAWNRAMEHLTARAGPGAGRG